ncbi:MAG TPA: ferritin-like domain-containing protein [Streptosporangiaceae bacterium]|nr:ferritin-like domain-containing protein [Streptosporangiaceae bacterium]
MTGSADQALAALQDALAAEQAASYGYGVVGARLPQGSAVQAAAGSDWVAHLRAQDRLTELINARGATPAPAAVAYHLPFPVDSPAAARTLAATLEDRVAAAYLGLVAQPEPELRRLGAEQVRAAALRAEGWRGSTQAFPGLPEASLRR